MSKCPFCKCGKKVFSSKDNTDWRCDNCNLVGDDRDDYTGSADDRFTLPISQLRMPQLNADAVLKARKKKLPKLPKSMEFIFGGETKETDVDPDSDLIKPDRAELSTSHIAFACTEYRLPRPIHADEQFVLVDDEMELAIISIGNILPSVSVTNCHQTQVYKVQSVNLMPVGFNDVNGHSIYNGFQVWWQRRDDEGMADVAWIVKHVSLKRRAKPKQTFSEKIIKEAEAALQKTAATKEELHRQRIEVAKAAEARMAKPAKQYDTQTIKESAEKNGLFANQTQLNKAQVCKGYLFEIKSDQGRFCTYIIMPGNYGPSQSLMKLRDEFKGCDIVFKGDALYPSGL